jgi:hypothetical protein
LAFILLLATSALARPANCVIRDGKLLVDGKWTFLKIAKPLINFADAAAVDRLIADLPVLKAKHYNAIEINCYWHQFDPAGDASDLHTGPLTKFVNAVAEQGMFPCLSVETYGVGGGHVPMGFWKKHPGAIAVDSNGKEVKDDEYGFGSAVPSLFSPDYLAASRNYIRKLTAAVPHERILWFETTVEPQYMGNHALDFSAPARAAWAAWRKRHPEVKAPAMPNGFPVPESFLADPAWNRFRAEWLADWVNGDAAAYRDVAGKDAHVAVDYLETCGKDMRNRNGDSMTFLRHLTAPNILQVNWTWRVRERKPNQCAYDHVKQVMRETGRDWAVTEHMTINGSDYRTEDMPALLRNTIRQGSGFGWEFVSVTPDSKSNFACYNSDWSPKAQIRVVDENWDRWMAEMRAAHGKVRGSPPR